MCGELVSMWWGICDVVGWGLVCGTDVCICVWVQCKVLYVGGGLVCDIVCVFVCVYRGVSISAFSSTPAPAQEVMRLS